MNEIWRFSAVELSRLIHQRELSARQAVEAALARLEAVNPAINAVVDYRPDEALNAADAVDEALARGEDPGLLAGVPVTVKVITDQAGFATTNGLVTQRALIAKANSPVVDSLEKAGAVIVGRTNTPAFSYRWFTANRLHGETYNPRDAALTPGGSSGGAAAAVTAGIGHLAQGTDIAGSIRYPAYACGVHGLRPSLGRVAAFNASGRERNIGAQLMAVSGPIGRTIADLRLGLEAMARPDPRDPWWVPAPLAGPEIEKKVALCLRPDGLATRPEIVTALEDAARRLEQAGWRVEELDNLPPLREAAELQVQLWLGDNFAALEHAARDEGDPGAIAALAGYKARGLSLDGGHVPDALTRRATLVREWQCFLARYPVVLMPSCAELPFVNHLDLAGDAAYARVWEAQLPQVGLPLLGLPALAVATGLVGNAPVGVQLVAGRFREDLCLLAGEAIEAGGVPAAPIDPVPPH